jgi:hypothetical protein
MAASVPSAGPRRGRESIIVDEWGPYDWQSPKLWPDGRSDERPLKLRVLGPPGQWRVASVRGARLMPDHGAVPGELVVSTDASRCAPVRPCVEDFDVKLVYRGARIVTPRGEVTRAGQPYTFGYRSFFVPADWIVKYYTHAGGGEISGSPLKTEHLTRLDFMSGRSIAEGVPADNVAVLADADVVLPDGAYTIRTISDDGVRVTVDGARVIDHWTPHESALDTAPLSGGRHHITVEYYEKDGFAELRVEILKRVGS